MAAMSSDHDKIDMLPAGQLEQVSLGMSPAGFDRDRDFVAGQNHLDSLSQITFEKILDFFRILRERQRPVISNAVRFFRRPVDVDHI